MSEGEGMRDVTRNHAPARSDARVGERVSSELDNAAGTMARHDDADTRASEPVRSRARDLSDLADLLDKGDGLPLAAVVEWAPLLADAWAQCDDARVLLRVYAHTGDRQGLVRAACACARTALVHVLAGELRPLRAIEMAEAWARGDATIEQVREAADAAWECRREVWRRYAAADVAYAAADVADAYAADAADAYAAYAADAADAAYAYAAAWRATHARPLATLSTLATLVRATVPCPTPEQLAVRREVAA